MNWGQESQDLMPVLLGDMDKSLFLSGLSPVSNVMLLNQVICKVPLDSD
jgi:hypothetical protein